MSIDQCCHNPLPLKTKEGFIVCQNCGITLSDENFENLWESQYEGKKSFNGKCESQTIPWYHVGNRTTSLITQNSSSKITVLSPKYFRLERIRRRIDVTSTERRLKQIFALINDFVSYLCNRMIVPNFVIDTVRHIYYKKWKKQTNFIHGYRADAFVYALFYVVANQYNVPVVKNDVVEMIKPSDYAETIANTHIKLVHHLFDKITITQAPQHQIIDRFAHQLKYSINVINYAHQLLDYAQTKIFVGRPSALISAILYVASLSFGIKSVQTDISEVCSVTDVTLRNYLNRLKKIAKTNLFIPYFWKPSVTSVSSCIESNHSVTTR